MSSPKYRNNSGSRYCASRHTPRPHRSGTRRCEWGSEDLSWGPVKRLVDKCGRLPPQLGWNWRELDFAQTLSMRGCQVRRQRHCIRRNKRLPPLSSAIVEMVEKRFELTRLDGNAHGKCELPAYLYEDFVDFSWSWDACEDFQGFHTPILTVAHFWKFLKGVVYCMLVKIRVNPIHSRRYRCHCSDTSFADEFEWFQREGALRRLWNGLTMFYNR